jgi:hypothetical protein
MILSPSLDTNFLAGNERNADIIKSFEKQKEFLSSLSIGFVPIILKLLVALSGILSQNDYRHIGPALWRKCLDCMGSQALASVSLSLVM